MRKVKDRYYQSRSATEPGAEPEREEPRPVSSAVGCTTNHRGMRYVVPDSEVELSAIRSQGPGGQHVNKTSTAVHLRFNISASGLPIEVKEKLLASSDTRISGEGVLVIKAQSTRSLESNKAEAMNRLQEIIDQAFQVPKRRKPTKPTFGSKQRRLEGKAQRSVVKFGRGKVVP